MFQLWVYHQNSKHLARKTFNILPALLNDEEGTGIVLFSKECERKKGKLQKCLQILVHFKRLFKKQEKQPHSDGLTALK